MAVDFMEQQAPLRNKLFAILLMLMPACNQSDGHRITQNLILNSDSIVTENANGLTLVNRRPFTGTIYTLYPSSKDTANVRNFMQGKESGIWKTFYENGYLKECRQFENGRKTGRYQAWWDKGVKQLDYFFKDDEYEGTCKEWNTAGLLTKEMNYKNGHEEGPQQCWYDNGKIKANYVIRNGRRFGLLGTKNCINVSDSIFKR
jgi:antitoxin component YwqK of YwqJK toxin-antitoxin module